MIKDRIKKSFKRLFPKLYIELASRRARKLSQRLEREWGCIDVAHQLIEQHGPAVSNGPFEGTVFPRCTFSRHISPKLIGSFEKELHPAINTVLSKDYTEIINVGCAEGYYAIGFSLSFPATPVIAFDTDPWARHAVRKMAKLNEVENISVETFCSTLWLSEHLKPNSLLFCDCEGFEDNLLAPAEAPALRSCDLIVEIHERQVAGVTGRIEKRFRDTHTIAEINGKCRFPSNYDMLSFLSDEEKQIAVNEYRGGPPKWLFMQSQCN